MVFHVSIGGGGLFFRWGISFLNDGGGGTPWGGQRSWGGLKKTVRWGAPPPTMGNPVYYDIYILAFDRQVMVVE